MGGTTPKRDTGATESTSFKRELLATLPSLRAFAVSLSGKHDKADDLVQDTVMKAWAKQSSFEMGTNIKAWLFTILRNADGPVSEDVVERTLELFESDEPLRTLTRERLIRLRRTGDLRELDVYHPRLRNP